MNPYTKENEWIKCWICHNPKAIYLNIAKNASSSMKKALIPVGFKESNRNYFQHLDDGEKYVSYFTFAVLREPIDRFIAGYCQAMRNEVRKRPDRPRITNYREIQDPARRFGAFVDNIEKELWDEHIQQQAFYLSDGNGRKAKCHYYLLFENLQHDFNEVCDMLGLSAMVRSSVHLPNRFPDPWMARIHGKSKKRTTVASYHGRPILGHLNKTSDRTKLEMRKYLETHPMAMAKLKDIYSDDIALYNQIKQQRNAS